MRESTARQDIALGMILALLGFGSLSISDGFIKSLSGAWPGSAVAALRYAFGALGLGIILYWREGRAGFRFPMPGLQIARGAFVAFATLAFFSSIFLMPLATATSIQFVSPMLTAVISALVLDEAANRKSWLATICAFAGVLIVLRPSFASLGWAAVLPLLAALGMACLMIANRKVAASGSVLLMQFLISMVAATVLMVAAIVGHLSRWAPMQIGPPTIHVVLICALCAGIASCSHMWIYMATVKATAARIAPMVYIQLLVAMLIGVIFYNDKPDALTLVGAAIIVASGLWLWRGTTGQSHSDPKV